MEELGVGKGVLRYAPRAKGSGVHAEGVAFAIDTLLQQVSGCLDEMEVGQERAENHTSFISVSGGSCLLLHERGGNAPPQWWSCLCVESALVGSLLEREAKIPRSAEQMALLPLIFLHHGVTMAARSWSSRRSSAASARLSCLALAMASTAPDSAGRDGVGDDHQLV